LYYGSITVGFQDKKIWAAIRGYKAFLFVLKINANAAETKKNQKTKKHTDLQ